MNSRKRFIYAVDRKETDRVPIDLGGYLASSHRLAYKNLVDYLNLPDIGYKKPWERVQQIVDTDEKILEIFHIDTRHIRPNPPDNFETIELGKDTYIDEWGVTRKSLGLYYDIIENPLHFATVKDLENFNWPDPENQGRYRGLKEKARDLFSNTEYAIMGDPVGFGFIELGCAMRGYDKFLMDMAYNNKFFKNFIDIAFNINSRMWELYLNEVGDYVQAVWTCDDFGIQNSMMFSPNMFRTMVKPIYKKLMSKIKKIANVKIIHHSCGSIFPIIRDISEMGVDVLNPIQPLAKDMSPEKVKKTYGSDISFDGAIDVQKLLNSGNPDKITREVKRVVSILGKGGGYILAPGHNIQPDVKPENVIALFDAIFK